MFLQLVQSLSDTGSVAAFPKYPPAFGALEKLPLALADKIRHPALRLFRRDRFQDGIAAAAAN